MPLLPPGIFPKLLFGVSVMAFYNTAQCFVPEWRLTPRIYSRAPDEVTGLMSRMMGTWTLTAAIIRIYTSYNMSNKMLYQLCMWTYVIVAFSFGSEILYFETADVRSPGVWPALLISSLSFAWMVLNYSKYTGGEGKAPKPKAK